MDHAITIGEVLKVVGVLGGFVLFIGICIIVLDLINPFRSGH